jgi:UDP-glucose 4-epimerase
MQALVTGAAGFIGSSLCEALFRDGHSVFAVDDLSSGKLENLRELTGRPGFTFEKVDCRNASDLDRLPGEYDVIFHLAANPEVRPDRVDPEVMFSDNVLATKNMLGFASKRRARSFVFTSSSTVYGDAEVRPTPEEYSPLIPVSLYGAAKLASEALVTGYSNSFGFEARILRLANVVGPRSGHGVIIDFVSKLQRDGKRLAILGDGTQKKSYVYVDDCVEGILASLKAREKVGIFNLGSDDQVRVTEVAHIVSTEMGLRPKSHCTGGVDGGRGWPGDVKEMLLDTKKLKSLGWSSKHGSAEAVRRTVRELLKV